MLIGITIENDMDNKHAVQFLNAYIKRKMYLDIKYYYYYAVIFDKNLHANAILVQCKMFIRSMFLAALLIFRVSEERGKKHNVHT